MEIKQNFQRTTIQKPIVMNGKEIRADDIAILTQPYLLEHKEFNILIDSNKGCKEWSKRFLLAAIGTSITIIGKVSAFIYDFQCVTNKNEVKFKMEKWEWISLVIAFSLSLTFFGLSYIIKDKKDDLISKIDKFFNNN